MNNIGQIQGLEWQENKCIRDDQDSFAGRFSTSQPINLVFRDDREGPYAIHLGLDDYLTFLGSTTNLITGYFFDCRHDSPTLHYRIKIQFYPNPRYSLHIAPGIAHSFSYSEKIFVINSYKLFLPAPDRWLSGESEWALGNDAIVLPLDVTDEYLPTVIANEFEASELLYRQIARDQAKLQPQHQISWVQEIALEDGRLARLRLQKRQDRSASAQWHAIAGIPGVGWVDYPVVWIGADTGVTPLLEPSPLDLYEYKCEAQNYFLVPLNQEECLTFLRISDQPISVTLIDCRQGSTTLHHQTQFELTARPLQGLVIPVGVAYRLEGISNALILNRPRRLMTRHIQEQVDYSVFSFTLDEAFPEVNLDHVPATLVGKKLADESTVLALLQV